MVQGVRNSFMALLLPRPEHRGPGVQGWRWGGWPSHGYTSVTLKGEMSTPVSRTAPSSRADRRLCRVAGQEWHEWRRYMDAEQPRGGLNLLPIYCLSAPTSPHSAWPVEINLYPLDIFFLLTAAMVLSSVRRGQWRDASGSKGLASQLQWLPRRQDWPPRARPAAQWLPLQVPGARVPGPHTQGWLWPRGLTASPGLAPAQKALPAPGGEGTTVGWQPHMAPPSRLAFQGASQQCAQHSCLCELLSGSPNGASQEVWRDGVSPWAAFQQILPVQPHGSFPGTGSHDCTLSAGPWVAQPQGWRLLHGGYTYTPDSSPHCLVAHPWHANPKLQFCILYIKLLLFKWLLFFSPDGTRTDTKAVTSLSLLYVPHRVEGLSWSISEERVNEWAKK